MKLFGRLLVLPLLLVQSETRMYFSGAWRCDLQSQRIDYTIRNIENRRRHEENPRHATDRSMGVISHPVLTRP